MKYLKPIFVLLIGSMMFLSCNDRDLTPVFVDIKIDTLANCIDVSDFNDRHETSYDLKELETIASSCFRDIECWLDGTYLGIFELPCKIPLLPEYDVDNELQILPCIRLHGQSSLIKTYSFLNRYTLRFDNDPEGVITIDDHNPMEFNYINAVQFPFIDNFEYGTHFEMENDESNADFNVIRLNGNSMGHIALEGEEGFTLITTNMITAPGANGNEVVWEITYACESNMRTAVKVMNASGTIVHAPIGTINDTEGKWKQMYINLTNIVNNYNISNISSFKLMLEGSANPKKEITNFYIDDVKVICYK